MTNLLSILLSTTAAAASQTTVETGFWASVMAFLLLPWVFYSILIIGVIILIALHENEEIGWSHTVFILIMAYLCYKFNIGFKDLIHNPLPLLKWIGIYVICGIGWSFGKWFFFLKSNLDEFNQTKNKIKEQVNISADIIRKNNPEESDKILKQLVNEKLYSEYNYGKPIKIEQNYREAIVKFKQNNNAKEQDLRINSYSIINPQANNYKALITTWITHWPVSLAWTLINDPIKKLINYIFEAIKSLFQKVSDKVFESTRVEL